MPELPEVECVRRTLAAHIVGRRIEAVRVTRRDIIRGSAAPHALLAGQRVRETTRHGKQLALIGERGTCVAVHLGMSGQLCIQPPSQRNSMRSGSHTSPAFPPHTHASWELENGSVVRFTDPRRFGGIWTFDSVSGLHDQRWAKLGPDALLITPTQLVTRLRRTRRGLKAALLDQSLVAGLGNIYVDELLYASGLHPLMPADRLDDAEARLLVRRMRRLLQSAIDRGGSSLRDYVDANNQQGSQQARHRVYGRGGLVCKRRGCGQVIETDQIAGRTTAWCPTCQPLRI